MILFAAVLILATVLGGFAGGEIVGRSFSVLGAAIGLVGTATVLLGLGAYFDSQERKRKRGLSPEMRAVFDRMVTGKENPTPAEVDRAKRALRRQR